MKLTVLSRYDRLGASSRLRILQYLPDLAAAGLQPDFAPFFSDDYLTRLYSSQSTRAAIVQAYLRRLGPLCRARDADLIWIEKEALPWLPWGAERALLPKHVPIVTDYDDAVFHRYDLQRSAVVRRVLGQKLDRLMAASSLVTAGNTYLADRARAAGAKRVEIVPTVVDMDAYGLRPTTDAAEMAPVIGWIGTPSTWGEYMVSMLPMLTDVAGREGARILTVGAGPQVAPQPLLDAQPWSEDTEVARIQEMDIGLMPLSDTPWARGKCGYKLIQYMACGLPVIASPVGVNAEIVEHGVNGFLATTEAEWRDALIILLRDSALRARMGEAGRKKVEAQYSLQVWGPQLAGLMADLARQGKA